MKIEKMGSTKRRDQIDTLRTIIWYSYIEMNFANSTNYKIEKVIEPESFRKSEAGNYFHSNKWTKYKVGKHTPGNKLISKANQHVKGTAKIINHIVWEAIRGHKSLKWFMEEGVYQLSWDVQRIIFKSVNDQNELISVLHVRKDLRRLERLASMDALAALIIFLRIADDQNQRKIALSIGHSIYRILLVMCVFLPLAKFRYELVYLIYLYVFPLCQSEMKKFDRNDVDKFYDNSCKLNYILLEAEDENIIDLESEGMGISKKMYTNFLFDILDGKRGLEMIREFSPSL
ncbi:hypothetical protein [Acinetobacter courvalinii]|uniref:hypothetical protein n=1 Tax=Acinetobacter courvalinii TaxID=280147 RepID=UPI00289FFC67|nr:hypothetical protein [Acinetobacter courvalinii]